MAMDALKEEIQKTRELRKSLDQQKELHAKGKQILRNQSQVLCKALQQLERRKELGQQLAGEIWDTMIDGITEELPHQFFSNHSDSYFWERNEILTDDELALKKLLDQALQKKKDKEEEEAKRTTPMIEVQPSTVNGDVEKIQDRIFSKVDQEQYEEALLIHLISVIKVAINTTEVAKWDWKKEDEEFKGEMKMFHHGLKIAVQLFEEIHRNPTLKGFLKLIDKIAAKATSIAQDDQLAPFCLNHTERTSCSEGSSVMASSSDGDSYYVDDTEEEEDDDDAMDKIPSQQNDNDNQKCLGGAVGGEDQGVSIPDQLYVVRQIESEDGKKKRPIIFKCTTCEHIDCELPPSHGRDWKRAGYWCNCGKKFGTSKEFDRHLTYGTESLVLSCGKCEFTTNRKCCMETHKKDMHDKVEFVKASRRLYKCGWKCGQVFETKKEMYDHYIESGRQCTHRNADIVPLRQIPPHPLAFLSMFEGTLHRSGLEVTVDRLDAVLTATNKDTTHARKKREKKVHRRYQDLLDKWPVPSTSFSNPDLEKIRAEYESLMDQVKQINDDDSDESLINGELDDA